MTWQLDGNLIAVIAGGSITFSMGFGQGGVAAAITAPIVMEGDLSVKNLGPTTATTAPAASSTAGRSSARTCR